MIIYTIGHSTHPIEEFILWLKSFNITHLVDIRSFPSSTKYPQYNKESLALFLGKEGITYSHLSALGGKRKVMKNSRNDRWHNTSFRGYADYMETEDFQKGLNTLIAIAQKETTAYMCAEALWWRCHRSMVSDALKVKGWEVRHIMGIGKYEIHPYTTPARLVGDKICYYDENLFDDSL